MGRSTRRQAAQLPSSGRFVDCPQQPQAVAGTRGRLPGRSQRSRKHRQQARNSGQGDGGQAPSPTLPRRRLSPKVNVSRRHDLASTLPDKEGAASRPVEQGLHAFAARRPLCASLALPLFSSLHDPAEGNGGVAARYSRLAVSYPVESTDTDRGGSPGIGCSPDTPDARHPCQWNLLTLVGHSRRLGEFVAPLEVSTSGQPGGIRRAEQRSTAASRLLREGNRNPGGARRPPWMDAQY